MHWVPPHLATTTSFYLYSMTIVFPELEVSKYKSALQELFFGT